MAKKLNKKELLGLEVQIRNLKDNFGLSDATYNEVKSKIDELYPNAENIKNRNNGRTEKKCI